MTTLIVELTPALARRLARAADLLEPKMTHAELARQAVQLMCDSVLGRGRPAGTKRRKR